MSSNPIRDPFVSVLVPVRNEVDFIDRSLGAILRQEYPKDRLEIIVIDGMSTDGTRQRVSTLASTHGNVIMLDNPAHIVPVALNLAMTRAQGDVIVRVDGHCIISPTYIRSCVNHLQKDHVAGVGGAITTRGLTPVASAIAAAMSSPFGVGGSAFRVRRD